MNFALNLCGSDNGQKFSRWIGDGPPRACIGKVDNFLIRGGMTYTFYREKGLPIGNSLLKEDKVEFAGSLMDKTRKNAELLLPVDSVVAQEFSNEARHKVVGEEGIGKGWMGLDIGPKTISVYSDQALKSKTILWNGPLGILMT